MLGFGQTTAMFVLGVLGALGGDRVVRKAADAIRPDRRDRGERLPPACSAVYVP